MLLSSAGIFSDRGTGISNSQRNPGKGRKGQDIRIRELCRSREEAPKGKKPSDGRKDHDFRKEGSDLQAERKVAEGVEPGQLMGI